MKKHFSPLLIGLSLATTLSSVSFGSSGDEANPYPLANSLAAGNRTVMILANDYETDPDSNLAGILAMGLAVDAHAQSGASDPLGIIVYTDDEYLPEDALTLAEQTKDPTMWSTMPKAKEHYQHPDNIAFLKELPPTRGLRAQDAAVDFFHLANFLNARHGRPVVSVHVVQGERTRLEDTKEPYINPYFGTFGVNYDESSQELISQINPIQGAQGVLELLKGPYQNHKAFLLSGGSARLSLELAKRAPELTQNIHNISVIGRIETPYSLLFNRQEGRPGGSWNARIDPSAFAGFFKHVAANPACYKSLEIVDSGTIFYAPVFDAGPSHLPLYAEGIEALGYHTFLPEAAIASKNMVEQLHTEFAWNMLPKAMDPVSVLHALGRVDLSMKRGTWQHIYHQFAPQDADPNADIKGLEMSLPWTAHGHPFVSTFPGRGESAEDFAARLEAYKAQGYEHELVVAAGNTLKSKMLAELLRSGAILKELAAK